MAPNKPNQERKRGRPPGSSATSRHGAQNVPSRNQTSPDAVTGPEAAPKKRGRPPKSIEPKARDGAQPAVEQPDQTALPTTAPKRRGRKPKTGNIEPAEDVPTEERPRKRRRGPEEEEVEEGEQREGKRGKTRGSERASDNAHWERQDDQGTEGATRRRGRRRLSDGSPAQPPQQTGRARGRPGRKADGEGQGEDRETDDTAQRRSRRGRSAVGDKQDQGDDGPSLQTSRPNTQTQGPGKRGRGRPSLAEVSVSKVQNQASPPQPETQEKKRGRRRRPQASNTNNATESSQQVAEPSPTNRPARPADEEASQHEHHQQQQQQQDPLDMLARHHRLTALTRHIPRATIASKWTPLSAPSIAAVSALLADSSRPVLHRLRDRDERHAQAALILRTFASRLHSKLVRGMPFPPPTVPGPKGRKQPSSTNGGGGGGGGGGHEVELDFEKTVDAVAGLERALDPLLHSLALLRREKEREERALERDYEALRRLEANARAQARGWKEGRGKGREHVLLGGLVGMKEEQEEADGERTSSSLELVPSSAKQGGGVAGGVFKDLQEEELLTLSQQIGSHMESMKNNLSQIEGVLPAIARSRAALQGVLCEHLDPEQYEQVLLG